MNPYSNFLMVISNNTLFDVSFEMNCNIHSFRSVDRGGLVPICALLTEHRWTAEKQHQESSLPRELLHCGAPMLNKKRAHRD